ncbi:Protein of unknown function DUF2507 [Caldalkalibacillus thermarum TA2.A1]|uniref:YslB family protein n=1 Tax=Caldalkalibacillus thermarum (strain TA2.A1) TaxID=986075 RepID=F5L6R7_CALTT|nr:DUF2507 domain-containing protein [Caldalkalibacillus thermarum]EGL82960.1 Protein of unknown function DUF2507 [Caldalkalibacillus thermarum TA2.A1]QZT33598.1 YslB family protein [Caldalkalibacillus thermarum TA2.A1]
MKKLFDHPYDIAGNNLVKMKGQAIPLISYHLIRDQLLPMITGEYQSIILYWAGRNLARQFMPPNVDSLVNQFLEFGWGELMLEQNQPRLKKFRLASPFFNQRQIEKNQSTFSLECGFLTEVLAQLENKDAEGEYKVVNKQQEIIVEIQVYLEEKQEKKKGISSA